MATTHEIVLIDGGDDAEAIASSANTSTNTFTARSAPPVSARVGADASVSAGSEAKKSRKDTDAQSAGIGLAEQISKALGGIGLVDTAIRLRDSFNRIYDAVLKLDSALNKTADKVEVDSEPTVSRKASSIVAEDPISRPARSKKTAEDFIEGEFTVSRPAATEEVAERGLSTLGAMISRPAAAEGAAELMIPKAAQVAGPAVATGGAEGVAAVAAAAGPLAVAIAGLTVAVGAGVIGIKAAFDALSSEAKRLENVSGDLSVATSQNEMRAELADIRRANAIGPDLARFENARGRLSDASAKVLDEIWKALAGLAASSAPLIEKMANGIEALAGEMGRVINTVEAGAAAASRDWQAVAQNLQEAEQAKRKRDEALLRFFTDQQAREEDQDDPFLTAFLGQFAAGGQL